MNKWVKLSAEALAFAVEMGLAFAVARQIKNALADNANALADADAEFANAFAEMRTRICTLEMHHDIRWSTVDECYYPYTSADDDDRPWPTMPDHNRQRLTLFEQGREGSTTLD